MVLTTAENLTHYKDRKLRWQKCTNHLGKHAELISFAVRLILWQTKGRTCCYKSREGRKEGRFKEKANLHFCCCWWEADNSVELHHETIPFAFGPASCLMQLTLESDKPTASEVKKQGHPSEEQLCVKLCILLWRQGSRTAQGEPPTNSQLTLVQL